MALTNSIPSMSGHIVVVGAGLAGLYTALIAAESGEKVILMAKTDIGESNTDQAQGGIAASISEQDSPLLHMQDTLVAGAGLCNPQAVKSLVEDGPGGIQSLISMGVKFDQNKYGLALTKEGAHSRRRILHAKGDSTGRVIREALTDKVREKENITVLPNTFGLTITQRESRCTGVLCLDANNELIHIQSPHVVIASGGACMMYANTTNPQVATGDGIAMAYRMGARLADMEFIQFHPTALMMEDKPRFLISEAVRGEGAILRNHGGERFMPNFHPQAELAPRDVVARAMVQEMERTNQSHLWLDVSAINSDFAQRFPTIFKRCTEFGLNLPQDMIPVAPAAHYFIGGVITDARGRTGIRGLYACGEASCTGVHGANRLASNSLLEALVYGSRIAKDIALNPQPLLASQDLDTQLKEPIKDAAKLLYELRDIMWTKVGLCRNSEGLKEAGLQISRLNSLVPQGIYHCPTTMELTNLLLLSHLVIEAALLREESRGGHYRHEFPKSREEQLGHWVFTRGHKPAFHRMEECR